MSKHINSFKSVEGLRGEIKRLTETNSVVYTMVNEYKKYYESIASGGWLQNLCSFSAFVWFSPHHTGFLFGDILYNFHDIKELIDTGIIEFKGFAIHQNETMLKYTLSSYVLPELTTKNTCGVEI